MARAVVVEGAFAVDAHPRHQAAGLVIDAGVDHLAVARGGDGADALGRFEHDHLATGLREPPRDRKADHAGPDDDAVDLVPFLSFSPNCAMGALPLVDELLLTMAAVKPLLSLGVFSSRRTLAKH